jgi:DNA repair protein RadC
LKFQKYLLVLIILCIFSSFENISIFLAKLLLKGFSLFLFMKLKDMCLDNRPRERLLRVGVKNLSTAELLAIVLGSGSKGCNVLSLSEKILSTISLRDFSKKSLGDFVKIKGVGLVKASVLLSLSELSHRGERVDFEKVKIKSPKDVFSFFKKECSSLDREVFYVVLLDTKHKVLSKEVVSVGTLNSAIIHPREVFKSAISWSAHAIILVHNHPSGDPSPSDEDREVTKILMKAGETLGIKVLDHVIIGDNDFWSFKENE